MYPNRTFALLVGLSLSLVVAGLWSIHHLLLAGAPALAVGGTVPSFSCLLLPLGDDLIPHLASYAFLLATAAGAGAGVRALTRQHWRTRALLNTCLAARSRRRRRLESVARRVGLADRLDVVDVAVPTAFCYGYLRPRVLVSTALTALLAPSELEALLLHEREHLRRRDPLKVALGKLLASALFFVPALGGLYQRYLVEKELAADRAAVVAHGGSAGLSAALVRLVELGALPRPSLGAGADEALAARVDSLLGEPVRVGVQFGPGGFAMSVVAVVLAALPLLAAPPPAAGAATSHNIVAGCHLRGPIPD